jgi:hypothetical protein
MTVGVDAEGKRRFKRPTVGFYSLSITEPLKVSDEKTLRIRTRRCESVVEQAVTMSRLRTAVNDCNMLWHRLYDLER